MSVQAYPSKSTSLPLIPGWSTFAELREKAAAGYPLTVSEERILTSTGAALDELIARPEDRRRPGESDDELRERIAPYARIPFRVGPPRNR